MAKDKGDVGKNAVDEDEGGEDSYSDPKKDHMHIRCHVERESAGRFASHKSSGGVRRKKKLLTRDLMVLQRQHN